jgi:hypothetical protein
VGSKTFSETSDRETNRNNLAQTQLDEKATSEQSKLNKLSNLQERKIIIAT